MRRPEAAGNRNRHGLQVSFIVTPNTEKSEPVERMKQRIDSPQGKRIYEEPLAVVMSISADEIKFDNDSMWVELTDGPTIGVPLAWFPRLLSATADELENYSSSPHGIHWESLDEDISVNGLLAGRGDQTKQGKEAAWNSHKNL